jgi:hypothetical protein
MNDMNELSVCSGRLSVDNGVLVTDGGINNCIDNEDGSTQFTHTLHFESDGPFNIIWERARDPFKTSSGFVIDSCLHVPCPFVISLCERSDSTFER